MTLKKSILPILFLMVSNLAMESSFAMIDEELEKDARSSWKSMVIYIENQSKDVMSRRLKSTSNGKWLREPAERINPGETIAFSHVSNGFLTGCEGQVSYQFPEYESVEIHWSNSFFGGSSTTCKRGYLGKHNLSETTGIGTNVVRYEFK